MKNFKFKINTPKLKPYLWALTVVWTVVVTASLLWNVHQVKRGTLEAARIQARVAHNKDIIYRFWGTRHGGVYVPVTEETQPNPYLSDIPERDITTPSGKLLTLMNPAYMNRQVYELMEKEEGVLGHITSLNPIRPKNAPDIWEAEALKAFERGQTEISSVEEMEGEDYMRLMRPLITEKSCLKCHSVQGYREGDIRGGISVSIPMESLLDISHINMLLLAFGHAFIWLIGMGGIALGTFRLSKSEKERTRAEEALQKAHDELEIKVEERTSELNVTNAQLKQEILACNRLENELRESEEKFKTISNFALDAIILIDNEGNIVFWNPAAEKIFGYSNEEVMGKDMHKMLAPERYHEDSNNAFKKFKSTGKGDAVGKIVELAGLREDGSEFPMELSISAVKIKGKWNGIGIVRDITERKKAEEALKISEERYSLAQMAADIGSWDWNIITGELIWSDTIESMFGFSRGKFKATYDAFLECVHPDDRQLLIDSVNNSVEKNEEYDIEHRIVWPDITVRWLSETGAVFRDEKGMAIRMLGIVQDITEKKKAEETLRRLTSLNTLNFVLENFIGDALGNTLAIVYGNIVRYKIFDDLNEDLKKSLDTADKFLNITIQGIRAYQNFSSLGESSDSTSDTLGSIIEPLLSGQALKTYSGEEFPIPSEVKVRFEYDQEQKGALDLKELPYVQGFDDKIKYALQETLINAIESYCPDAINYQPGEIVVSARKEDDNIIIDVRDNGMCMNPEVMDKVQLPFYKVPAIKSSTRLGLGAYVALQGVKYGGGDISIESTPDVGTTVSLLFKTGHG